MDDEQKHWEHINPSCMTEESDDDGGEKIVTHKLQWRSPGTYVHMYVCIYTTCMIIGYLIFFSLGGIC